MENSKTHNYYFKEKDGLPVLWTQGFIAFICLNVFIFLGFDVLLPTLTLYLESHGHSRDAIGRIFSFFMIAAIFMRIIAPKLVLIVRPFTLVRLGLFISSLAVASYYFAHSAGAASAARFFHGLGFGITSTILTALAAQTIPSSKMAQGMGFLGLGTILTLALGPSFGIWLKDSLGYYAMFLTVAGVYLGGLLWTMKMPAIKLESSNANRGKPKFVLISRKALIPSILLFLTGISISSMTIYLPLYFNEKGLSYSGLFFGLATTGIVFARLFSGRIHDRYGHKFTITPALICMFFANFLVTMIGGPVSLFITSFLWGISSGSLFPSIQALTFTSVAPEYRTEAASSIFNAFDLGIGAGSIAFGLLAEHFETYKAAFWGNGFSLAIFITFYVIYFFLITPSKRLSLTTTNQG